MEITIYSILIWLSAILIASLDLVIFLGSRNISSRVFSVFTFLSALWASVYGFHMVVVDAQIALLLVKCELILGLLISSGFYYFSKIFPNDVPPKSSVILKLSVIVLIFYFLYFQTNLMVSDPFIINEPQKWGWKFTLFNFVTYVSTFFGLWIFGFKNLFRKFLVSRSKEERINLKYMISALVVGVVPPFILNIIFPLSNFYKYGWFGPLTSVFWIFIIAHSILRYRQMNVRVVAAETLTLSIIIVLFFNIFTDFQLGIVGRILFFVLSIILGYFIIRGALAERDQKETLESFNKILNEKVAEQTVEIKRAYEVEKKANRELKQLDQHKNDFIIITQHHLRTPIAQIRWFADSIMQGLYGDISRELSDAVSRIDKASGKLAKTLNDFLAITQLKIGTKVLNVQPINLKNVIEIVLREFASEIKKKKITVSFSSDNDQWPLVLADLDRTKDVFTIIIDNAILYNHPEGGWLSISTVQKNGILIVNVINTGVGLSKRDKESLLKQSFYRSKVAKKVNPFGMGIGLLVAKTIVEAHNGNINIESDRAMRDVKIKIGLPLI